MKTLIAFLLLLVAVCVFAAEKPAQPQSQPTINPVLEAQIWLDRKNYSPGEIDGTFGKNMQMALDTYRTDNNLASGDKVDEATLDSLREQGVEPLTNYTITDEDVKGPFVERIPKDYTDQSHLESLGYTSALEALAEKFHASPALLKKLNPKISLAAGSEIRVPNVIKEEEAQTQTQTQPQNQPQTQTKPVQRASGKRAEKTPTNSIVVTKDKLQLLVQDPDGKTLLVAPITAGSDEEPYPFGAWKVNGVSRNPRFEYDPSLFKDAPKRDTKAKLPPGPNSPVGVVWIELSAPHYGIHGTPDPGRIGYSESHGCIRLTNWDAVKVAHLVKVGTPVTFQ